MMLREEETGAVEIACGYEYKLQGAQISNQQSNNDPESRRQNTIGHMV